MAVASRFWDRTRDYVVFGVLMAVSLGVFVGRNGPALRAARAGALAVTGRVEGAFSGLGRYTHALGENDRLRAESITLAAEVARLREARAENRRLRTLLDFADSTGAPMIPARVVSKDVTRQENLLTINAGAAEGVAVGMPVIDERGIVGKVTLVGRHYAAVMPHQSTQFSVPATLELLQQDGIVRWDGERFDRLLMEYVVKTEPVVTGQLVVTSGYSGVFPAGVPVGVVDSVFAAKGRNDLVIYLRPASPISQVNYVYVVQARPDPERIAVEDSARALTAAP